jgi:amino acid transporter
MTDREPEKPKAMKNGIVYTRDFEVVEMSELTAAGSTNQFTSTTTYAVSASKRPSKSSRPSSIGRRWVDSFKRVQGVPISGHHGYHINDGLPEPAQIGDRFYDVRAANARTANSGLARDLKGRHLQMIAIGGSIGMFSNHGNYSQVVS